MCGSRLFKEKKMFGINRAAVANRPEFESRYNEQTIPRLGLFSFSVGRCL